MLNEELCVRCYQEYGGKAMNIPRECFMDGRIWCAPVNEIHSVDEAPPKHCPYALEHIMKEQA
jgi:hypothetical protein